MPATTGGRPTSKARARQGYKTKPKVRKVRKVSAPRPDVTLGGDRSTGSGHSRARTPKPTVQGHPSRGRPTVAGGTKGKKVTRYKSPTPSIRKQRQRRRAEVEAQRALKRSRKALARVGEKRDTDTHIGPLNIEAELEGRGTVSKYAEKAKKVATSGLGQSALKSAGVVPRVGNQQIEKNLAKDAVDFGAQTIPGAYGVGASIKEAAEGRPQRGKKLIREAKMHDPIVLTARSVIEGRPELRKRAEREALKHPGLTLAEVYGAGAAVSRGAGAAVRGAAKVAPTKKSRRRLRKIGNTKRAPRVAPGTGMLESRRWSKGLGSKAVQVLNENRKTEKARKLRDKAKRTRNPTEKARLRAEAQRADPRVMSTGGVARRTNEREDLAEVRRRDKVGRAAHETRQVLPKKDHRATVALLIAQKIVRPTRESVKAYRNQLDREIKSLDGAKKRTAIQLRNQLNKALADEKIDFDDLVQAGDQYAGLVVPRQQALVERQILAAPRERKAKLVSYAVQEMGARWRPAQRKRQSTRPEGDGWEQKVDKSGNTYWSRPGAHEVEGRVLATDAIEAHMRANDINPESIPFVTQAPGQGGARNFFQSWHDPRGIGTKTRTGEATRTGAMAMGRETGVENVTRMEGMIQGTDSYAAWLGENSYRSKGQTKPQDFPTRDKALEFAADELADSPYEWTAVPTRPVFGRSDQSRALLDQADAADPFPGGIQEGIIEATKGNGDGPFVLVPTVAAKTLRQHEALLGQPHLKAWRKGARQFSATVLTSSGFTWPIGNTVEGLVRLAALRAGGASYRLARMTIEEMRKVDPERAADYEARIGDGHLGSYEMQRVHTVAKEFNGTRFEGVARALGAFFRAPGPKQVGAAWNAYTRFVFQMNGKLEHQLRIAALGKHLQEEGYRPRGAGVVLPKWMSDGPKQMQIAARQAADGQKGTNEQVAAARFVDRAMGRYSRDTPEMRFTKAVFTPFVAWALNAVKFFTDVLPRDHPVLLGLLATSERATEEWRKQHGLGKFVDGAAANWLQASIVVDGKLVPVGRFTPAGLFSDPLQTGGGLFAPSINGLVFASKGLDWKGDPLNGKDHASDVSEAERLAAMGGAAMGSFIPFFSLQERVRDKGATAINPARSYKHDPIVSKAYDDIERLADEKKEIADRYKARGIIVDSDHPTPEYARLHRQWRAAKKKTGYKFKEPYRPTGKPYKAGESPSGGYFDDVEDDSSKGYFDDVEESSGGGYFDDVD